MDAWCVHAKGSAFLLRNSYYCDEKSIIGWKSRCNSSIDSEIRFSVKNNLSNYRISKCRSGFVVRAMAKKNHGNPNSENNDNLKAGGDGLKGNNPPSGNNKSGDTTSSNKSESKPLDWREFRASLYIQEQQAEDVNNQETASPQQKTLPLKWAHPISSPENGCLLVATEKLDGVRTFERTVVLLIRSGTRNPQEWPFGVVINRPLHKKMKHMNPTNTKLATTFADCSLHFGGPLDASMFLLKGGEAIKLPGFEDVVPGVYFGSRNSLDKASGLVKKGMFSAEDCRFFMGYAGWQVDQLTDEIESGYWHVAACSPNLILGSQNSSSESLWEEVLQLMGGHYSELSRKPKRDV